MRFILNFVAKVRLSERKCKFICDFPNVVPSFTKNEFRKYETRCIIYNVSIKRPTLRQCQKPNQHQQHQ